MQQPKKPDGVPLVQAEAAIYLSVSESTLEKWRSKGTGPAYYKTSAKVYYFETDLLAWIKSGGHHGKV